MNLYDNYFVITYIHNRINIDDNYLVITFTYLYIGS